jgi:cell division septal protein FtsQ
MRLRPLPALTRRGRRRLSVVAVAGFVGLTVPVWVPLLLATLPAFSVEQIRVVGSRHVPPDEVKELVALQPEASVWDDGKLLEDRVRVHPMIQEATVRRAGLHALEIVVVEKHPVALVATPELRPVGGDGRVLPLDPAVAELDLPIINGLTRIEGDLVADPSTMVLARLLDELERSDPGFVSVVSEVAPTDGGWEFTMLPDADAATVLLPLEDPLRALMRVSAALGQLDDPRVVRADARFSRQVVLTRERGR